MKKTFQLLVAVCTALVVSGCGEDTSNICHISGTVDDSTLEGKRIFLVPLTDSRSEVVDSIEIKDGKFEFSRDTLMMAKVIMDYHFRMNTQTLLVVVEPGELNVNIGKVSSASGTPQNDSLQRWKGVTEAHNNELAVLRKDIQDAKEKGDKVAEGQLKQKYDSIHLGYKNFSRRMAANMPHTVLGDFLSQQFPKTYEREFSNGMVVLMDADTKQPLDTLKQPSAKQ